jgi:hypothetical protein
MHCLPRCRGDQWLGGIGLRSAPTWFADDNGVILSATDVDLDGLTGCTAAEANHEDDRRRRKRLDAAFGAVSDALAKGAFFPEPRPPATIRSLPRRDLRGRWRIVQMDLWDPEDLDLVEPAFIEFEADQTGRFGFIAVSALIDYRPATIEGRPGAEFSFQGTDEGDEVTGRGWAALRGDDIVEGRIYFHMGDDSGFRAIPVGSDRSVPSS